MNDAVRPTPDLLHHALWPTVAFVYLLVLLRLGGYDDAIAAWFYDQGSHAFPLRHAFLTETVMHDIARKAMIGFAVVLLAFTAASLFDTPLARARRMLVFVSVSLTVSVLAVNLGKQFSNMDCPWDLLQFGGDRPYVGLFAGRPATLPVGHCFPGGHSSAGFALFALYFGALGAGWSRRNWLLSLPLVIGLAFAAAQWARGAHYPSHDLVSAYLCWMIPLIAYRWVFTHRQPTA